MNELLHFRGQDGVRLAYRRWSPVSTAQNAAVVLIHGAASNSTRWWHFVEHSRLVPNYLLLCPDLRGHGDSVWRGPSRMEHWCRDIAAMLQHERCDRVFIVGHCLGANIALNFAARYPNLCAGLVLIEPISHDSVTGILMHLKKYLLLLRVMVKLVQILNKLGLYRRQFEKMNLHELDLRVHQANPAELEQALAKHGSPWHDIKVMPTVQYLANFIELFRPLPVSGIRCPCFVIQSSGQRVTDPQRTKIALCIIPNTEFIEIESEHWIPATQPDRLCQLIDDWILRNRLSISRPI